ncbi:hypothetical protein BaRGS_00031861 [Batillaria attramentaria]|uniref:Sulfatase N-terminal domain-containing protein n=1 Tax=Batillaria attramentaria TaxID=370345 RepID=A0ABD0JPZ4_9CAEN
MSGSSSWFGVQLLAVICLTSLVTPVVSSPPHIIFVVADDLGWNDVGWHNPAMITPNLNRFARNGVILNSSYVQYYCSPSRNAFMTGYFPYHTGLQHGVIMGGEPRYVPSNFTMLPQLLKKVGYKTHVVGKWHLGMCNWKYTPTYRGFDTYFGYYNGAEDYYTHITGHGFDMRLNTSVAKDPNKTHFDYLFTQHAVDVIQGHDDPSTPLFLYLPFHLCHAPLQVPAKYENMYKQIQTKDRRIYCGMVSMMDEALGNITQALEQAGLMDNTLLIFTTDNGGPVIHGANNWPLRGAKTTMMHAVDWFPTILYLAGSQPDSKIDGVNQWDMLSTGGDSKREEFVYNIDTILNSTAIRYKDYKLMTGSPGIFNDWYPLPKDDVAMPPSPEYFDDGQLADVVSKKKRNPRLYNIRLDPEERNDLSETEPDMMTFMMNRLQQWMKSGVPPQNSPSDPKGDPKNWGGVWTPGWC